ncbi:MAG TPA: diacylglycerol kinase family protein [Actinomycetaceae bacterium]|nr:diacylglycerol kinase family protein [Actinomycetaceae bacterium]
MAPATPPGPERSDAAPVVIVNPIKSEHPEELRRTLRTAAREAGLPEPVFVETTIEESGMSQARAALEAGSPLVIAAGGDGTVRAVATGMADSGVPLGIIPLGTGNLLARNLDIPVDQLLQCARTAFGGTERPIDVGWLRMETPDDDGGSAGALDNGEHAFLVIGGIGFDAEMIAGADHELKRRLGWFAYFYAALTRLFERRMSVLVTIDDRRRSRPFRARTVMVANCGRLPGNIVLAPSARLDDGWLDVVVLDTRGGLVGWASLGVKVLAQRLGIRGKSDAASAIESRPARSITIRATRPTRVQVDGELLGKATALHARVAPAALLVRVAL